MGTFREKLKRIYYAVNPTYRTLRRIEQKQECLVEQTEAMFWWSMNRPGEPMSETKRRVFAAMPPAEGFLRELQLGNFRILQRLKQVCEENGLRYWLDAGTLLGALRHQGFIPWDDDIDVGMLREDVERLCAILADDPEYTILPYFRTAWTAYVLKMVPRDRNSKCWLDILLYDVADTQPLGEEETWKQIQAVRKKNERDKGKVGRRLSRIYHDEPIDGEDRMRIEQAIEKNLRRLPESARPGQVVSQNCIYRSIDTAYVGGKVLFQMDEIFPTVSVTFEGETFSGMHKGHEVLMRGYRDYMRLPPDVRPSHTILWSDKE